MNKAELRQEIRRRLAAIAPLRESQSRAIVTALLQHPRYAASHCIALFSPVPGEPDIAPLWGSPGRSFCYPRIRQDAMEFVEVTHPEDLTPAPWHRHIREVADPDARIIDPSAIDMILVPGMAFTPRGERLGRGGGFYDRYLPKLRPSTPKIGVCFAVQLFDSLPAEDHDQAVDCVVTENGFVP